METDEESVDYGITGKDGSLPCWTIALEGIWGPRAYQGDHPLSTRRGFDHHLSRPHESASVCASLWRSERMQARSTRVLRGCSTRRDLQPGAQSHVRVSFDILSTRGEGWWRGAGWASWGDQGNRAEHEVLPGILIWALGKVAETPQKENHAFFIRVLPMRAQRHTHTIFRELSRKLWSFMRAIGIPFQPWIAAQRRDLCNEKDHPCRRPAIKLGLQSCLYLGNLDDKARLGYAVIMWRHVAHAPAISSGRLRHCHGCDPFREEFAERVLPSSACRSSGKERTNMKGLRTEEPEISV